MLKCVLVALWLVLAGCVGAADVGHDELATVHEAADIAPVIFLEYDYMVAGDHSHAPHEVAIERVVEAFQREGIRLQISPRHDAIPETEVISFGDCAGYVDFYDLKAKYFEHAGSPNYHYAIFAHDYASLFWQCVSVGSSGVAELPGNDFIVAMGRVLWILDRIYSDGVVDDSERGFVELWENGSFEGGTLMHELGHNLGLQHGGDVFTNGKPNYLSVMNYSYQIGVPTTDTPGSVPCTPPYDGCRLSTRRLDYSDGSRLSLDEAHLDERAGVGSDASLDLITFLDASFMPQLAAATGPVDWDGDGDATELDVSVNLNASDDAFAWGESGWTLLEVLHDFDDWSHLRLDFVRPPGFDHRPLPHISDNCPVVSLAPPFAGPAK